jgi:putative selenate reductase
MLAYQAEPLELTLQRGTLKDGELEITASGTFRLEQRHQVLNIADLCNECGNCATFCPTADRPYRDKPRLCLTEAGFELEDDCFYLREGVIKRRVDGRVETLTEGDDHLVYETDNFRARLARDTLEVLDAQSKTEGVHRLETDSAAAMWALLSGLRGHYLFSS